MIVIKMKLEKKTIKRSFLNPKVFVWYLWFYLDFFVQKCELGLSRARIAVTAAF